MDVDDLYTDESDNLFLFSPQRVLQFAVVTRLADQHLQELEQTLHVQHLVLHQTAMLLVETILHHQ